MRGLLRFVTAPLVVVAVLVPLAPASAEDGRIPGIVDELRADGVVIDAPYGRGQTDVWERRIRRARDDADRPVYVVLPYAVRGDGIPEDERRFVRELRAAGAGNGYYVVGNEYAWSVVPSGVPSGPADRQRTAGTRVANAVRPVTVVAGAWFAVRLLATDPPAPEALIREARAHPSYFPLGEASPALDSRQELQYVTPLSGATAGVVVLVTIIVLVRVLNRRERRAAAAVPVEVFELEDLIEPYAVQRRLADLATALAQQTPSQDDPYVRATRCSEAAARYADSARPRDRLGAALLAMEGLDVLTGRTPHRPCVFNPLHQADRVLSRTVGGVRLERAPCCTSCMALVRRGDAAGVLRIPDTDGGEPEPFDGDDDVWTRTAYGAHSTNLAEQALTASFEERR